jgi:hypothetical protein
MSIPILISFNVRQAIREAYGLQHFVHLEQAGLRLVPVVTTPRMGLEQRSRALGQALKQASEGLEQYLLVSYSFSGLDARLALAGGGVPLPARHLTWMTANGGSRLAEMCVRGEISFRRQEALSKILGLYPHNLAEFTGNQVGGLRLGEAWSLGGECPSTMTHPALHETAERLTLSEPFIKYDNDGVVGHNEFSSGAGRHLANLQTDHLACFYDP